MCFDTTSFALFDENGKVEQKLYLVRSDMFAECFSLIKKMVPECELMPWVLKTSEDYEKKRLWHEILGYGLTKKKADE